MTYKQKSLIFYVIFLVFLVAMFTQKQSFHVDELWSYGLANYEGNAVMEVTDGVKYDDPEAPFLNYLAVKDGQRFDYSKVWENQRNDNHPVLFYVLLHTISSFFPGKFSLWFGAVINIAFALVLLLYVRKLLLQLTHSRSVQTIGTLAFLATYGIVNSLFFIRMYVMVMALQTMLSYLCLLLLEEERGSPIPEDLTTHSKWFTLYCIFAVTYFSALTHYYCIVYAVFLTLAVIVLLLCRKDWKTALQITGAQLLSGLLALATFPSMLERVFGGDRGAQSMENLQSYDSDSGRLQLFFEYMNKELFGGLILLILIPCALGLILYYVKRHKSGDRTFSMSYYLVLLFPVVVYFAVIVMTAPLRVSRYLYPLYPIIFVLAVALFGMLLEYVLPGRKQITSIVLTMVLCLTVFQSFHNLTGRRFLEYLYPEAPTYLSVAADYSDCDCLYIYHYPHDLMTSYKEVCHYKSVTFVPLDRLDMLEDLEIANNDKLILRSVEAGDGKYVVGKVLEAYPQFTRAERLFYYSPDGVTSILT